MRAVAEPKISSESRFDWPVCYEAENYLLRQIDAFLQRNAFARSLADRMREETGTLFLDWTDHLLLSDEEAPSLRNLGYEQEAAVESEAGQTVLWHPEAMLPRVIVESELAAGVAPATIAIRVDSISDFIVAHQLDR